jgi:hypothetical protein
MEGTEHCPKLAPSGRLLFSKPLKNRYINFGLLTMEQDCANLSEGFMGNMKAKVRLGAFAGALGVALMATTSAFAIPSTVIGRIQGLTGYTPTGNYIAGQIDFEK